MGKYAVDKIDSSLRILRDVLGRILTVLEEMYESKTKEGQVMRLI